MKECGSCGVIKPVTEFHRKGADGLRPDCRVCTCDVVAMRGRVSRGGGLSMLATQPTAEAHRVWMAVDRRWGGERRLAA